MVEPDWLVKAMQEGRATVRGVNHVALAGPAPKTCPLDKGASEKEFQAAVIDLAHQHGWKVGHFRKVQVSDANGKLHWETPVAADGKGWPDLFLAKAGFKVLVPELKVKANTPSPEQWDWIHTLRACGLNAVVWYPSDWGDIVQAITHAAPVDAVELQRLIDDGCPHAGD